MKTKYYPSEQKLDISCSWNRFDPTLWEIYKKTFCIEEFVDLKDGKCWDNDDSTVVFILNMDTKFGKIEPLSLIGFVMNTYADEFHYIKISKNKYIIRMWWD